MDEKVLMSLIVFLFVLAGISLGIGNKALFSFLSIVLLSMLVVNSSKISDTVNSLII